MPATSPKKVNLVAIGIGLAITAATVFTLFYVGAKGVKLGRK